MSIETPGHAPLDYNTVAYPGSMVEFRGPPVDLDAKQVVCLGGSETFGRFVAHPFAQILSASLGRPVANLGALNAGLELILNDGAIGAALAHADQVVLQVTGAHLMTNRFYRVHPRRNDRFLRASTALSTVYRSTDFTEFHFVRHMLSVLAEDSPERFAIVVSELQEAWTARMCALIERVEAPVHVLWIAAEPPAETARSVSDGTEPLFITKDMLEQVATAAATVTVCTANDSERVHPTRGMFFGPREAAAARILPGPAQHDRAADLLAAAIG
ncbi:hypothetical protein HKCCE2091_11670 [Rhodobacterales bacterium HKCCE2091]|nr:hypothetical protein [Rhodobacterales bacterium HKCCE2091]